MRREVMKKAWEIFKKSNSTFSESLKMAWTLIKAIVRIKKEDYVENGSVSINLWFNYGYARAYIKRSWVSKYQNGRGHFIDLTDGCMCMNK